VNNLPKFVNTVHQTPFSHFLVNIVCEHVAKVREQCSPNQVSHELWGTMFTNTDHAIDHQGVHELFGDHITLKESLVGAKEGVLEERSRV
jgi:hypothetical protein